MVPVLFITFVVCLFVGVPVAFSLGLASLAYFLGRECLSPPSLSGFLPALTASPCCASPALLWQEI